MEKYLHGDVGGGILLEESLTSLLIFVVCMYFDPYFLQILKYEQAISHQ